MGKPCDLGPGMLDMLVKILALEPINGFAVGQRLKADVRRRVAGERRIGAPGFALVPKNPLGGNSFIAMMQPAKARIVQVHANMTGAIR